MRRRVEDLVLPLGLRPPLIATFHSTCVRILREHAPRIGLPAGFVIYDEDDRLTLVKEAMRELQFDERELTPASVGAPAEPRQESDGLGGGGGAARPHAARGAHRLALSRVRDAAPGCGGGGLRRPPSPRGAPLRDLAGHAGRVPRTGGSTSWWTSTRTPTAPSTASSVCSRRSTGTSAWWAIPTSRCTAGAAPTSATSSTSRRTSPTAGWCRWSRTTAPPSRSSAWPRR